MSRETEKLDSANVEDNTDVPNAVLNSQGPQARNKGEGTRVQLDNERWKEKMKNDKNIKRQYELKLGGRNVVILVLKLIFSF